MQCSRDFFDVKKESPRTPNPRRPKKILASFFRSESAALFANDAPQIANAKESIFMFGPQRAVEYSVRRPPRLPKPAQVFRMVADGPRWVERSNMAGC